MRNEWKFNRIEVIDNEQIKTIKLAMLISDLEIYGKEPTNNYPWVYLLKRIIEEVEKRDWLFRDEEFAKTFYYLKEGVVNRTNLDEERDKKIYESGIRSYFIEGPDFRKMFDGFIQGIRRFEKEW